MTKIKVCLLLLALTGTLILPRYTLSASSYTITVHNMTHYPLEIAKLNIRALPDMHGISLPPHKTITIPIEGTRFFSLFQYMQNIEIKGTIANKLYDLLSEEKDGFKGPFNHEYYIFAEHYIERKQIPGGFADLLTKVRLFLFRKAKFPYPGGIVGKTDWIPLSD